MPEVFGRYPLNFNMHVAVQLFDKNILQLINDDPRSSAQQIAKEVVHSIKSSRNNHGHMDDIRDSILEKVREFNRHSVFYKSTPSTTEKYMEMVYTKILEKYRKKGKFHHIEYFYREYIFNADLYGVITMYCDFIRWYINSGSRNYTKNMFKLCDFILWFIQNSHFKIDKDEFMSKLKAIRLVD